jgi:hypothetical protein
MIVRLGIPPLNIIPGFQEKFLSDGIIDPPVPITGAEQPAVGALLVGTPFADPHWPFTGGFCASGAEHCAVVPPPVPMQLQVQGPVPLTVDAVPALHIPELAVVVLATPFAGPH